MMRDIVERLRESENPNISVYKLWNLCKEVADEIERLRAELSSGSFYKESDIDRLMGRAEKAEAENERLRNLAIQVVWSEIDSAGGDPQSWKRHQQAMSNLRLAVGYALPSDKN